MEDTKQSHHAKEDTSPETPKKPPENQTAIKPLLIAAALIPGYFYFFGYTFFRSKMRHLGFDVTISNMNIQEIIYQGYQALTIALSGGLTPVLHAMYENLIFLLFFSLVLFPATIGLMYFMNYWKNKRANDPTTFRKKIIANQNTLKGKMKNAGMLIVSLYVVQIGFYLIMIFVPVFCWMYLSIPDGVGGKAAMEEVVNFSCNEPDFEKHKKSKYFIGCSDITLKNNKHYLGRIIHIDDKNIYLLTEFESIIVANVDIDENKRAVIIRPEKKIN